MRRILQIRVFTSNQITIEHNKLGRFHIKNSIHDASSVDILLRTPYEVFCFTEVEIFEDAELECAVCGEAERLLWRDYW